MFCLLFFYTIFIQTQNSLNFKELCGISRPAISSLHRLISRVHLCTVSALVQCAFKEFHWKHASLMRLLSVITQHECSVADRWDFIYPPQSELAFRSRWHVIIRQHLKVLAYRTEVPNIRPESARQRLQTSLTAWLWKMWRKAYILHF